MWGYYWIGNGYGGVAVKDMLTITAQFGGEKGFDYSAFTTAYDKDMLIALARVVANLLDDTAHALDLSRLSVSDVFNNYLYLYEHMPTKSNSKEQMSND